MMAAQTRVFSVNERTKQRDSDEENDEDDGDVENQPFHASPGLKHSARRAAKALPSPAPRTWSRIKKITEILRMIWMTRIARSH
jgi:hypothetical protein